MKVRTLWRVRGIDRDTGEIRQTRIYAQGSAAAQYALGLAKYNYIVRLERAKDIEFELLGVTDE